MPHKYTLEYLKNNKVAVNCRTESETKQVYDICRHNWGHGAPERAFEEYEDQLCLNSYLRHNGSYSDIEYYESEGYTIISASDFLKDWKDESIVSYLSTGHGYIRSVNFEIADQTNDTVTDTNVGEIDNATTIAAIRTHLTEVDNLLKTIK